MTHFFQPLDLTVNSAAKQFTKKEFVIYYSAAIQKELNNGNNIEDIEVDLKLSTIKPLHAQWLVNLFNHLTTADGKATILKGWKNSGLLDGTTVLLPEDPFEAIFGH